jgi:serine/threonine-protein kinase
MSSTPEGSSQPFPDTRPEQPVTPTRATDGAAVDPLFGRLPRTFGRYLIRQRLGKGGMGAVYLADDNTLERPVALKVALCQGDEDSAFAERFRREAKAAARLRHEDPVLETQRLLRERLGRYCSYSRAVSFANQGR